MRVLPRLAQKKLASLFRSRQVLYGITANKRPKLKTQAKVPALNTLHRPLIKETEKIDPGTFSETLRFSKFFHRILNEGGPITRIPLLGVVNPSSDYSDNYELPQFNGCTRKRLIPKELLAARFKAVNDPESFARKFINGEYPRKIVFKPHASDGGDGILKLERKANYVKVTMRKPGSDKFLALNGILNYAKSQAGIQLDESNDHSISLTIDTKDLAKARNIIANLVRNSLTITFPYENEKIFSYTDIQSGLIEPEIKLLKLNGRVIEGRYYVLFQDNQISLSKTKDASGNVYPSYLKLGTGTEFVNGGDYGPQWPNMHEGIINDLGLDCSNEEFNNYIWHLIVRQVCKNLENLMNLFEDPQAFIQSIARAGFIVDIAWEEGKLIEVPRLDGGTMQVPKPLLMEMPWELKMKQNIPD